MHKIAIASLAIAFIGLALWCTSLALAPTTITPTEPPTLNDAVVRVYGADVWGFRGYFAIHTWIATKAAGTDSFKIYQVIGWRLQGNSSALSITTGKPDKPWFRSPPLLLHEVHGQQAEQLIDKVHDAALSYPHAREYVMWPGPNSNSFTAWVALKVPELGLNLPMKAIGKDWMIGEYAKLNPSS